METVQNQAVMAAQLSNEIEVLKATVQNQAALAADLHQTKQVLAALCQALGVTFSPAPAAGLIESQADVRDLSQLFALIPHRGKGNFWCCGAGRSRIYK